MDKTLPLEPLDDLRASLPPTLSLVQVADLLQRSPETVKRYASTGRLRALKPGRGRSSGLIFIREDVVRFLSRAYADGSHR